MQLHANWRAIMRRAWSIRLIILAFVLSALAGILPAVEFFAVPAWLIIAVSIAAPIVDAAAFVARVVAQKDLED